MKDYDVIIIGAGVSGCAIARELAKGKLRIAVLEAKSDVCEGTSKANSGIVHAGYDAVPGTLKAQLNVRGNEMMEELSKKLDFPFRRTGSLVLCFEEDAMSGLEELYQRGMENGVKELKLLSPEEVWAMEPAVSRDIVGALYAPTGGIVCPFGLNIALAENAAENGVEFYRHPGGVGIVAVDENGRLLMVRQYRSGMGCEALEIPAGKRDPGETPEQCGRRELEEECGFIAGRLEPLAALYPTPAYCDEKIWIFTAKDLTPGHTHPDEDEFITAEWVPLARAEQMVLAGEIEDAKTQIAILKYTALRRKGEVHE